jgi:enoyl-CoA hydratase
MSDAILRLEVSDHIALVTLTRPPVNALDRAMRDAIIDAIDAISEREDVRVAVLTGQGHAFSPAPT